MKSIAKTLSRLAALIIHVAILMSLSQTAHALSTPEVNTGRVKRIAGGYWPAVPRRYTRASCPYCCATLACSRCSPSR